MIKVNFYELSHVENNKLDYAVIQALYREKWVYARHKERNTWEAPGGHRDIDEDIASTAARELFEETGAIKYQITPICVYSVESEENESFGQLFFAVIDELGELPDYEIAEVKLFDSMPEELTYPTIQPFLFSKAMEYCKNTHSVQG